jgi:hypothetical protein
MDFELNKEFLGHFAADGAIDHVPYGTFKVSQDFTASLKIHTSFKDRILEAEGQRIGYFGYNRPMFTRVDGSTQVGNIVLLTDGGLSYSTNSFAPNMSGYSEYTGFHTTLISKKIDLEKQHHFKFDKIRLRFENMAYFFGESIKHFIFEPREGITTHQFEYDPKGKTLFVANMDKFRLEFSSKLIGAQNGVKFKESGANLQVGEEFFIDLSIPKKKVRLNQIYELRGILENFFTFTCGVPCLAQKVVGFQGQEIVDIYFNRGLEEGIKIKNPRTFRIFDSTDFLVHHDRYLTRWYDLNKHFPNLIGYTNSPLYYSIGAENLFLNYVAGVEGYLYQRIRPKILADKQPAAAKISIILDRIKAACSFLTGKIFKEIKKAVSNSTQMINLEEQLNRLIDESGQDILINQKDNIEIIRKIRNKLAHGDGSVYAYFTKEVNHRTLFPFLRLLATYAILKDMGFTQSKIKEMLFKSLNQ